MKPTLLKAAVRAFHKLAENSAESLARNARIFETKALSEHHAALRSTSPEEFRHHSSIALSHQKRATQSLAKSGSILQSRLFRSQANETLLRFWLSTYREEKMRLLEESWNLAKRALESFRSPKDSREYVKTFNLLSFAAGLSVELDGNLRSRVRKLRDASEHGKRAVTMSRRLGDRIELTKALIRVAIFLDGLADDLSDKIKQRDLRRESRRLWEEALQTSREIALYEFTHPLNGFQAMDPSQNMKLCEEALQVVKPQRDNFALGRIKEYLAKWTFYAAESSAGGDPVATVKLHTKALRYAEEAASHFDIVNHTSPIAGVLWVHSPYTEHFIRLAYHETNSERRSLLEEKSLRSTRELLKLSRERGSPRVRFYALFTSSRAKIEVAKREGDRQRRRNLLTRALSERLQANTLIQQIFGSKSWNFGVAIQGISDAQSKLAELEHDPKRKATLLTESIRNHEKSLRISVSFIQALEPSGPHFYTESVGRMHTQCGDLQLRLASITENNKEVRRATKFYLAAADWYEKIPRYDRSAECYWKSAECYDQLQAYSSASEYFKAASRSYTKFGRLVPPLSEHSRDYSRYLQAWSEIETARSHHLRQQFTSAANSYRRAANLYRATKRWRFLAPHYLASSMLESGEALSSKGDHKAAAEAFRQSATAFRDSKSSLKELLFQLEQPEMKNVAERLSNSPKDDYCLARLGLEKADIAETVQDYQTSFEEFGLASQKFDEISRLSHADDDRKEATFLARLCEAWQSVSGAELGNSVEPLIRARELFQRAKSLSPDERALRLARGHEALCEALIASRKFADSVDPAYHDKASKHLELAYEHFLDAGFKIAAYHARARRLLLDATFLLSSAESAETQQKKTELYRLADSLLRESSTEFRKARQPLGREQVRRLLQRSHSESEAPYPLVETLRAAADPSTTTTFIASARGGEKPVGVERFERGNIETNLDSFARVAGAENDVEFAIEISNIGKQSIRLLRLDEIIPVGTELVNDPDPWKPERYSLTHSSKVLAPTKTERVRLVLRLRTNGLLKMRPKVVFVDESGWRWERVMNQKIIPTSRILEFLASSFIKDNASRLQLEQCGWKSMMEIVKELKIPRSHVYGERRYGRAFGKQLDQLVKSSFVEYRIFPNERGRGGNITRVRLQLENDDVKNYIQELSSPEVFAPTVSSLSSPRTQSPISYIK